MVDLFLGFVGFYEVVIEQLSAGKERPGRQSVNTGRRRKEKEGEWVGLEMGCQ